MPLLRDSGGTLLAINVGGALIPVLVSLYLLMRQQIWLEALVAVAFVAIVTHHLAQPIRGLGIALPIFAPAMATALVALVLSRRHPAPVAYIAGSLGTLIGADLMNLDKNVKMGAPIASIGGAGTFDSIFLTAIIAVLVASLPFELFGSSSSRT